MPRTNRELWLLTLLPAIICALTFAYVFGSDLNKRMAAAQTRLKQAQATAVAPLEVEIARASLLKISAEQEELKKVAAEYQKRKLAILAYSRREPGKRTGTVQELNKTLWQCGLVTYDEAPMSDGQSRLPDRLENAIRKASGTAASTASQPRLWQVRFYGKYRDVLEALETIAESDAEVIPIGITMAEASPETPWRNWTLLLWL